MERFVKLIRIDLVGKGLRRADVQYGCLYVSCVVRNNLAFPYISRRTSNMPTELWSCIAIFGDKFCAVCDEPENGSSSVEYDLYALEFFNRSLYSELDVVNSKNITVVCAPPIDCSRRYVKGGSGDVDGLIYVFVRYWCDKQIPLGWAFYRSALIKYLEYEKRTRPRDIWDISQWITDNLCKYLNTYPSLDELKSAADIAMKDAIRLTGGTKLSSVSWMDISAEIGCQAGT